MATLCPSRTTVKPRAVYWQPWSLWNRSGASAPSKALSRARTQKSQSRELDSSQATT